MTPGEETDKYLFSQLESNRRSFRLILWSDLWPRISLDRPGWLTQLYSFNHQNLRLEPMLTTSLWTRQWRVSFQRFAFEVCFWSLHHFSLSLSLLTIVVFRYLPHVRGPFEEEQSQLTLHYLRHFSVVRFCWQLDWFVLPSLPKDNQHLCSLLQGMDQGKDLHPSSTTSSARRLTRILMI